MKRKLVSSYLLNANWYVILMHCNNTHDTRQIPEPSSPAPHPPCFILTTDTGSGLSCKVVRCLPLDAAAQAFIFLINFNARKNFRLAPCAIYMPHVCNCVCVGVTPGTSHYDVQRSLFLANNQIAQTATETERDIERGRKESEVFFAFLLVDCLSFVSQ